MGSKKEIQFSSLEDPTDIQPQPKRERLWQTFQKRTCTLIRFPWRARRAQPTRYQDDDKAKEIMNGIFTELDYDKSGSLDVAEVDQAKSTLISQVSINRDGLGGDVFADIMPVLDYADMDGSGYVEKEEWEQFCEAAYEVMGRQKFLDMGTSWLKNSEAKASAPMRKPMDADRLLNAHSPSRNEKDKKSAGKAKATAKSAATTSRAKAPMDDAKAKGKAPTTAKAEAPMDGDQAATKIQSIQRGNSARAAIKELKTDEKAMPKTKAKFGKAETGSSVSTMAKSSPSKKSAPAKLSSVPNAPKSSSVVSAKSNEAHDKIVNEVASKMAVPLPKTSAPPPAAPPPPKTSVPIPAKPAQLLHSKAIPTVTPKGQKEDSEQARSEIKMSSTCTEELAAEDSETDEDDEGLSILPVFNDTELSKLAQDGGCGKEFFYEPWLCSVVVTCLDGESDIDAWKKAGHHPNWENLFFTHILDVQLCRKTFAVSTTKRQAMELSLILPRLPSSARWDCVLQLSTALAVLHHRGVALGGISRSRIVGIPSKDAKWTFMWVGMMHSTMNDVDEMKIQEVREFGELALEILGSLVDRDDVSTEQTAVVERLRLCTSLPKNEPATGRIFNLLPSVCESFSSVGGFWKASLQHYETTSLYWSGLGLLESGDHKNAQGCFKQALDLDPFNCAARCALQQSLEVRAGPASTWERISAIQRAGKSPSARACVATTLLRAGWIVEAWWYSVQTMEELARIKAAWKDFDLQVIVMPEEGAQISVASKSARRWQKFVYARALFVISRVQNIAAQVLKSSPAFTPLTMLAGIVPGRCICPTMDLFGQPKKSQSKTDPGNAMTQELNHATTRQLESKHNTQYFIAQFSKLISETHVNRCPNVLAWLMSTCKLGDLCPHSLSVQVVQPSGLLVWIKQKSDPNANLDDPNQYIAFLEKEEKKVGLFLEYLSDNSGFGSWNSYLLAATNLHSDHRIIHSVLLSDASDTRKLFLMFSNNEIETFTLKRQNIDNHNHSHSHSDHLSHSHRHQEKNNALMALPPDTSTTLQNLLFNVGLSQSKASDPPMLLGLSLLANDRDAKNNNKSLLMFVRLASQNLQAIKLSIHGELKALEATELCVSIFPELSDASKKQLVEGQKPKLQMKLLERNVHLLSKPVETKEEHRFRYVIVGGGVAAGYACREYIKRGVPKGQICMISNEPYAPYERPAISKGFILGVAKYPGFCTAAAEGDKKDEQWYHDNGIVLFLSTTVVSMDFNRGRLQTDNKGTVIYENCMLCTGAAPMQLDIPGAALNGIYYLRNINDGEKVIEASKNFPGGKVAVIGGGYLGVESAAAMVQRGHQVSLIYRGRHLMTRLWSPEVAAHYEAYFEAKGATLLKEDIVVNIEADSSGRKVSRLTLNSGRKLDVDFLICCVGATIPKGLYEGKLAIQGRGVKVNQYFQTSIDNVYAVGDIACFPVKRLGRQEVMEQVGHARRSSEHAVRHMMGVKNLADYEFASFFYSRFFNLSWVLYGDPHGKQFICCKKGVDSIPGTSLKICCVWTKGSGGINGIFLEGASDAEKKMAEERVEGNYKVQLDLLQKATCYDDLVAVLQNAQVDDVCEKDQPCALSTAEISKMLQKLPLGEYHYLGTGKFQEACDRAYESVSGVANGALRGDELLAAFDKVLEPARARFVHQNLRNDEQINNCCSHFGGKPARDFCVEQEDFHRFVLFSLAYFLWTGLTKKTPAAKAKAGPGSAAPTTSEKCKESKGGINEETDNTDDSKKPSGLENIPESAAMFFIPHLQEAVMCLEKQLIWWQLPWGEHKNEILRHDNREVQIYCGRDLPFKATKWSLCGGTLVALSAQPRHLALLDASVGDVIHWIPLELAGLQPAPSAGMSVSNGVVAVNLGGYGRIWAESFSKETETLSVTNAMAKAMSPRKAPKVNPNQQLARMGWHNPPELVTGHSWAQPPPVAAFDTACPNADQCLVLPHLALWCTSHSVHASIYQQDSLMQNHTVYEASIQETKKTVSTSQLCRMGCIEPTAPVHNLLQVWLSVNEALGYLDGVVSHAGSHLKGLHAEEAIQLNAVLESCVRVGKPLRHTFHDKFQALRASIDDFLRVPRISKTWSRWASILMQTAPTLKGLMVKSIAEGVDGWKAREKRADKRILRDFVFLSDGETQPEIATAAVSSSGHSLLLVGRHCNLQKEVTWSVELWLWGEVPGQWKRSWSQVEKRKPLASSALHCGISGDGQIAATASFELNILNVKDGDVKTKLAWTKGSNTSDPALRMWVSEDGKTLVINTVQGIHIWLKNVLVQSIDMTGQLPTDKLAKVPRMNNASCHLGGTSYTIGICFDPLPLDFDRSQRKLRMAEKSWCFILRYKIESDVSFCYKLVLNDSAAVVNMWITNHRVSFLTKTELEIWQIPHQKTSNQVEFDDMGAIPWLRITGSHAAPHSIGVLQPKMFLASFQLPQDQVLQAVDYNPFKQVLFAWDPACSAVIGFVVPWAKYRCGHDFLSPDVALHLKLREGQLAPSFEMCCFRDLSALSKASHDKLFILNGASWSSWTIDIAERLGCKSISSSGNNSCKCCGELLSSKQETPSEAKGETGIAASQPIAKRSPHESAKANDKPSIQSERSQPFDIRRERSWQAQQTPSKSAPTGSKQAGISRGPGNSNMSVASSATPTPRAMTSTPAGSIEQSHSSRVTSTRAPTAPPSAPSAASSSKMRDRRYCDSAKGA